MNDLPKLQVPNIRPDAIINITPVELHKLSLILTYICTGLDGSDIEKRMKEQGEGVQLSEQERHAVTLLQIVRRIYQGAKKNGDVTYSEL